MKRSYDVIGDELPIPAIIWEEKQVFYDAGFVAYVETAKDRTLPPV